tara:strand:- start:54 stop:158 length:105 start_codon:yes stop_codon:yes gene_type:complete
MEITQVAMEQLLEEVKVTGLTHILNAGEVLKPWM